MTMTFPGTCGGRRARLLSGSVAPQAPWPHVPLQAEPAAWAVPPMTAALLSGAVRGSADPGIFFENSSGPAVAAPRHWRATGQADGDEEVPVPGEQPIQEETPRIDHAPVPPLTSPEDTEGG